MDKIKCEGKDCIRLKGSNALIYGFGYHDIFGDVLRSPHYSEFAKAPVMTLLGLNIEILLKGIIMVTSGEESWKGKQGHSIKFLLTQIPQAKVECVYEELSNNGFSKDQSIAMISEMDKAFVDYRYHYENANQTIDSLHEEFLKRFWMIIYEILLVAQQEYIDQYV